MTVYTGNFEVGVSYQRFKGFRVIKSFTKKSFNFCADISAKVAMTAECKIDIVVLEAKAMYLSAFRQNITRRYTAMINYPVSVRIYRRICTQEVRFLLRL